MTILIAAPHTPFDAAGALNPEVIPCQARALKNAGCGWVFVAGSTAKWPFHYPACFLRRVKY